ncbi:MAG: hypothetical protein JWP34_4787 [Massilia sp.]|nr:hypothetical protein [Massilia sp.]
MRAKNEGSQLIWDTMALMWVWSVESYVARL